MEKEYKNLVLGCQNCKKDFVIEIEDFNFYLPAILKHSFCRRVKKQYD
jgi:hypothetical protein